MEHSFLDLLGRSVVKAWLTQSQHSWRRLPVAHDSPHVHAPGANPDRILLAGDGASAGVGVLTHELGLPGYLARRVSSLTGRATDVDIAVSTDMTVSKCVAALVESRLDRYDVIVLSLGVNESLNLDSIDSWRIELTALLDFIQRDSPASTETIVLSIPYSKSRSGFPRILARVVDRRAARMNAMSKAIISGMDRVRFVAFASGEDVESDGAHAYDQWARGIAPAVSQLLAPSWSTSMRTHAAHEQDRQEAVEGLGLLDMPPDEILDEIATTARDLFGTQLAAVTFIDSDRQFMASAVGMDAQDMNRKDAFCDITIRRPEHFVIEDALLDPRYSAKPLVAGAMSIRFYAGYPLEALNGQRVGALCIMDTSPHQFSKRDAALLRDLAQRAQTRLWDLSEDRQAPRLR